MRFLQDQGIWLIDAPADGRFEVAVAGDASGPSAARHALIQTALNSVEKLLDTAQSYLDEFVARAKFAPNDDWYLEGVESGRAPSETEEQCSFYFTLEADLYGEWSVTFQLSQGRFYPVGFARKQV